MQFHVMPQKILKLKNSNTNLEDCNNTNYQYQIANLQKPKKCIDSFPKLAFVFLSRFFWVPHILFPPQDFCSTPEISQVLAKAAQVPKGVADVSYVADGSPGMMLKPVLK